MTAQSHSPLTVQSPTRRFICPIYWDEIGLWRVENPTEWTILADQSECQPLHEEQLRQCIAREAEHDRKATEEFECSALRDKLERLCIQRQKTSRNPTSAAYAEKTLRWSQDTPDATLVDLQQRLKEVTEWITEEGRELANSGSQESSSASKRSAAQVTEAAFAAGTSRRSQSTPDGALADMEQGERRKANTMTCWRPQPNKGGWSVRLR